MMQAEREQLGGDGTMPPPAPQTVHRKPRGDSPLSGNPTPRKLTKMSSKYRLSSGNSPAGAAAARGTAVLRATFPPRQSLSLCQTYRRHSSDQQSSCAEKARTAAFFLVPVSASVRLIQSMLLGDQGRRRLLCWTERAG